MDIVEAILIEKKKYIVLLSGYLWWNVFNDIVEALGKNLNFEIIYIHPLVPDTMLITSADHINFPVANELIKKKLTETKKGLIVVSYTFPPERIEFYPDFHINISTNQILLTSLIVELAKEKGFKRIDIDNHISYLTKSWKTNKIGKSILFFQDYMNKINDLYSLIFDSIMDNIMKKLYGEKYEEYKTQKKINTDTKLINVSDPTKISPSDAILISDGIKSAKFTNNLDDIIIETDSYSDSYSDSEYSNSIDLFNPKRLINPSVEEKLILLDDISNSIQSDDSEDENIINNLQTESSINSIKEMMSGQKVIYIGRRTNEKTLK